jgi:transcription antitermination factor NusG
VTDLDPDILKVHPERRWCALHTRARHEKKVLAVCQVRHVPSYLPLYQHRTFSGGRTNTFLLPMFPGYVFAALGSGDLAQLRQTNSVAQKIDTLDEPGLVQDLTQVMTVQLAQVDLQTTVTLQEGQKVQVITGPLAGVYGTVLRQKNRTRLQIVVGAISQAIVIDIQRDHLEPVGALGR